MGIRILATGKSAKESFIQSLAKYGFDINRLPYLTEAVFFRSDNYTLVTITNEGEIALFTKSCEDSSGLRSATPKIATFEPPKTSFGYNHALTEAKKAIQS